MGDESPFSFSGLNHFHLTMSRNSAPSLEEMQTSPLGSSGIFMLPESSSQLDILFHKQQGCSFSTVNKRCVPVTLSGMRFC